jgi:hypothetical protein
MSPFRTLGAAIVILAAGILVLGATAARAQDVGSLRVARTSTPGEVLLTWTDGTPTNYCIERASVPDVLATVDSAAMVTYVDVPPAGGTAYYSVEETGTGACMGTPPTTCAPAGPIACGGSVSANNAGPGSTAALATYAACGAAMLDGREVAYTFTSAGDADVRVVLSGFTADLDVVVMEERGRGCDPADCVAGGDVEASFAATAGTRYYIVVDGAAGVVSDFTLDMSCAGGCAPSAILGCGATLMGDTTAAGSTDSVDEWSSCGLTGTTSREVVHPFGVGTDARVDLTLTAGDPGLVVFVLRDDGAGCNPATCVATDTDGDGVLSFDAVTGTDYLVVVDGTAGSSGAYSLDASCATTMPGMGCDAADVLLCGGRAGIGNTADPDGGPGDGHSDAIDSYPGCPGSPVDMSGPEMSYVFAPAGSGDVTLSLVAGGGAELDVFVLQDSCDGTRCIAWGDSGATFPAVAGTSYRLVVDGRVGAAGPFSLAVSCAFPPTTCAPAGALHCGEFIFGNNAASGSTDVNAAYPSCGSAPPDFSGPEYVYQFVAPPIGLTEPVVVTVGFDFVDDPALDIIVAEGDCSPTSCMAWGDSSVTFTAFPGQQYFVIVDGQAGVSADYRIFVDPSTCQRAPTPCMALPIAVGCGTSLPAQRNDQPGSTDAIDSYPSCSIVRIFDESGPEVAYALTPPTDTRVNVSLGNVSGGIVHLYVLREDGDGCVADDCIAMGVFDVAFDATGGTTYYVVVDGTEGAVASFDVSFSCS